MPMLIAALRIAQTFPVFPVSIWRDRPDHVEKTPITPHGHKDASRSAAQIREWWELHPAAGIGLATGHRLPSGRRLVVIDIDLPNSRNAGKVAGMAALRLLSERGLHTPTRTARTGSGGCHLYYSAPHDLQITCGQALRIDGQATAIDWRGQGGYVVAPPSPYPGSAYRWATPSPWVAETIQEMPGALLALLTRRAACDADVQRIEASLRKEYNQRQYGNTALRNACAAIDASGNGNRHATLNLQSYCIGKLIAGGCIEEAEAEAALIDAGIRTGKGRAEVVRTVRAAFRAGAGVPRCAPERLS